uniref:ATP synthase F0 subunit 8 n=1 Tax=Amblyomma mixtum TaxID=1581418 RepID=UPI0022383852|nr:ATP synthase F0 subunit 8 [Amblyomma mixtum]UYB77953.1 ATP synthase F0 subunit 8 [Amblyomma mixtum]
MPQLYPMMWTILTFFLLLFSTILMTSIFFVKPNYKLFLNKSKINYNLFSFKW